MRTIIMKLLAIAAIAFMGLTFFPSISEAVEEATLEFDEVTVVSNLGSKLIVIGNTGGEKTGFEVIFDPSTIAADDRNSLEYCEKAALLALTNNPKYKFSASLYGMVIDPQHKQFSVNLTGQGFWIKCELNAR